MVTRIYLAFLLQTAACSPASLSPEDLEAKSAFKSFDTDNSEFIEQSEWDYYVSLSVAGAADEAARKKYRAGMASWFNKADLDKDSKISFKEWRASEFSISF